MSEAVGAGRAPAIERALLKKQLRRNERRKEGIAFLLVVPAFLYLVVNFVVPVAIILFKAVDNREVSSSLTRTTDALAEWDGREIPGEAAFVALAADLREAEKAYTLHTVATRLNSTKSGFQALLWQTVRKLRDAEPESFKSHLIATNKKWGETSYWAAIKRTSNPVTPDYLLAAFDLTVDEHGNVAQVAEYMRAFNTLWLRTLWMAFVITLLCVVLGYPLAYVMANVPTRVGNILLVLVLLPFWTALLVRTTAWLVLLQNEGLVNDLGLFLGLWDERVQLIRNRFGTYVAMSHILLPFMVLPLFAIMKRIPGHYMRAAKSLGANPAIAFIKVYLPLTRHGVGAGALFVFILAVGFYITPALVGGRKDQMISYFIAFFAGQTLNWGAAGALSTMLLLFTALLYFLLNLLFGLNKMRIQ